MNRTTALILGIVLIVVSIALFAYRITAGANLGLPMQIGITALAVACLLGGLGALSKMKKR